tara:strand:+ start:159 stop:995 length:837 start_codon:yes stop_codon:yes gene_type:complete
MKHFKFTFLIIFLLINTIRSQNWNSTGDNLTTGNIIASNPQNPAASASLSWINNIARIRIGGNGVGADNGFVFQGVGDFNIMRLLANGNVGIGTVSPSAKLEVFGGDLLMKAFDNDAGDIIFQTRSDVQLARIWSSPANGVSGLSLSSGDNIPDVYISNYGNVGIGTINPNTKLTVKGAIHAEEVKVDLSVPAPDYVFKEDYKLKTLEETQQYIKENGHLPNIPSAQDFEENGIELGEMNMKLLEKIEELTLYILEQNQKIDKQQKRLEEVEAFLNIN